MPRLRLTLLAALVCAAAPTSQARELKAGDPVRTSLLALARDTQTAGLPDKAGLSFSRTWVDGAQATVCALTRGADGELLLDGEHLQLKRVRLHRQGTHWAVWHSERLAMAPTQSIDTACAQAGPEAVMSAAARMLEDHPPTAGVRTSAAAGSPCPDTAAAAASATPELGAGGAPGYVSHAGRSRLHTAPDTRCYMGKFIVGGDKVRILAQRPGWTRVRYTHPLTGVMTDGWLQDTRVRAGLSGEQQQASLTH